MLAEILIWIYLIVHPSIYYYTYFLSDVVFNPDEPRDFKLREAAPYVWYTMSFEWGLWVYLLYVLTTQYVS
jgi:hypothetical protein